MLPIQPSAFSLQPSAGRMVRLAALVERLMTFEERVRNSEGEFAPQQGEGGPGPEAMQAAYGGQGNNLVSGKPAGAAEEPGGTTAALLAQRMRFAQRLKAKG